MRSGRPWGPLKGDDLALHDLARFLRGVVDASELTSKEIGRRCGCSDSTVSKRLGGDQLPEWPFVAALIDACTPDERQARDRRQAVRQVWDRSAQSHYRRPTWQSADDPHTAIVAAQAETIAAQRQLLKVTEELSRAHKQLAESAQVEFQASQVILVLQIILTRLSGLISSLTRDRDRYRAEAADFRTELEVTQGRLDSAEHGRGRAETQLGQAKEERRRASALTDESRATIRLLETRLAGDGHHVPDGVESLVLDPVAPTPDDVLLDTTAGLDRVQRLLDAQDRELTQLESERPSAAPSADARYRSVFADSMSGIAVLDLGERILEVNSAMQEMFGFTEIELCGRNMREFVSLLWPDDWRSLKDLGKERRVLRFEAVMHRVDGDNVRTMCTLSLAYGDRGEPQYQVAMFEDISELHRLQSHLVRQSLHDPLTNLPNRALFLGRLENAVGNGTGRGKVGVCFLGIDGFKVINDVFGHGTGDKLLAAVGRLLERSVKGRRRDVARTGGDEFAVLFERSNGVQNIVEVVEGVMRELEKPVLIDGHDLSVSVSAGIVERPVADSTVTDLVRDADVALRWAKADGRARWALYDAQRNARELARSTLATQMSTALDRGEFYLEYQPSVRLDTAALVGVEALIRWEHPEFGALEPERFIDVAEETSMVLQLDRWMLRQACHDARHWLDLAGSAAPFVSVNISARLLRDRSLVQYVMWVLGECALPAHLLQLEFAENALMGTANVSLDDLRALAEIGVRIAVDDFGAGRSSTALLKHLLVHEVKIAESFVRGLSPAGELHPADQQILSSLISLTGALSMSVSAAGIDAAWQAERLLEIGFDFGQGSFFGDPVSPEHIDSMLLKGL